MKFRCNQPRSQPSIRVARLEAIPMRLPNNPPLTWPALAQLDNAPEDQVRRGKTTTDPDRHLGTLIASDTRWSPPPGRSSPDSGLAVATTSLIGLRKRRRRIAGLSGIVAAARVAQR